MISIHCLPQGTSDHYVANLDPLGARWNLFRGPRGGILGAHLVDHRRVNDDLHVFVVRTSNGACLPSDDEDITTFCGKVYYRELYVEAPSGFSIVPEVPRASGLLATNRHMNLVTPGDHVFPAAKQFVRRFALYRGAVTAAQARAAIDEASISFRDFTLARNAFGPSKIRLPDLNVARQEGVYRAKLIRLRAALQAGIIDLGSNLQTIALGPFHPTGNNEAGEPGGSGIYFVSLAQSESALLLERMYADLAQERMTSACFNRNDGKRITSEDWAEAIGSQFQPFETKLGGDEEAHDPYAANEWPHYPPALSPARVWNPGGFCPYEAALAKYDSHDDAHFTRATLSAKVAAYLLGDRASIEFLLDTAHHVRQAYCDIGFETHEWARNLRVRLMRARAKPGRGSYGRAFGWIADTIANGHELAKSYPRTKRELSQFAKCGTALLELTSFASLRSGIVQRAVPVTKVVDGKLVAIDASDAPTMWTSFKLPPTQEGARSFEHGIRSKGEFALMRTLGRLPAEPPVLTRFARALFPPKNLALLIKAAKNLYDNPTLPPGSYDGGKQWGPPNSVAVAPVGGEPYDTITVGTFQSDPAHVEPNLAELYRATGNRRWINRMLVHGKRASSLAEKREYLRALVDGETDYTDPEWGLEALSVLQEYA